MVIAIDGPAGAGKSTVARAVAERLGYTYLDTGAMYRCVGLAAAQDATTDAGTIAARVTIELGEQVLLDGRDVTAEIRTAEASEAASRVAADLAVRKALVRKQQEIVATGDWVAEGRDIGTVVAPDAAVKVYLVADPEVRARRREAERPDIGADALATDLKLRDESDRVRMEPAADAQRIDTTHLEVDDVVSRIEDLVRARTHA